MTLPCAPPLPLARLTLLALRCAAAGALALLQAACTGQSDGALSAATPVAGASAAGAGGGDGGGGGGGGGGRPASAVSVTLVPAVQRDLKVQVALTGSVTPLSSIDLKPQVTASVTQVHVREGQMVRAGDLLFSLDTRSDDANVARLKAQLAKDQATLAEARRQLQRSQVLVAQGFISQAGADANASAVETAQAVVAADQAAIDAARVTQGQARITAPQAGRVGAVAIYPGSVVKASDTTLLTITQLDPMDVAFSLPQRYLPDALAALKQGGTEVLASQPEAAANAAPLRGRLQFIDNAVDPASGTVKVKARFANPQATLWPGAFVKLTLTVRTIAQAVVVPQAALIQSARGTVVYVVADGKAQSRPVQLLHTEGGDAAVSGVQPGEQVVLDGRQNLRPGSAVVVRAPAASGAVSGAVSGVAGGAAGGAAASTAGDAASGAGAPGPAASRSAAS